MQAVIIDDEADARTALRALLNKVAPDIEIVGEAGLVSDAVKLINKHAPQIVFSDIDMPILTGLQLLDFFNADDEALFVGVGTLLNHLCFRIAAD